MLPAAGTSGTDRPTAIDGGLVAVLLGLGVGLAATSPVSGALCGLLMVAMAARIRDPMAAGFAAVPAAAVAAVPWPLPALFAVVAFVLVHRRDLDAPWAAARGRRRPRPSAVVTTGVLAAVCAGAAHLVADMSLPPHMTVGLPEPSAAVLVVGVVLVSLFNAAGEELLWRGALFSWLSSPRTGRSSVVSMTAVSFGLSHVSGIPSGVVGVLGATALGGFLAVIRPRVGLVGCIVIHAAVDSALLTVIVPRAVWIP